MTWTTAPLATLCPIEAVDSANHHPRLPAVPVPSVDNEQLAQCLDRAEADRQWRVAWAAEGMHMTLDDSLYAGFALRFDDVLNTHPQRLGPDPDPVLWELTERAGDDRYHGAPEGTGAWALSLWALDRLRYVRFSHISVTFFERLVRSVLQLVQQSPIGRLVCWRRRMDEAYQPADDDDAPTFLSSALSTRECIQDPIALQQRHLDPLLRNVPGIPSCCGVPYTIYHGRPTIWLLHLFSGRRRSDDCHSWLTRLDGKLWDGMDIYILSFDTALHSVLGNLARGDNLRRILRLARSGIFSGCITGPPCETWSAARHLELAETGGPRPLRTALSPWCLPDRSLREMVQCSIGTQLMCNSWEIEVSVTLSGGGSIQEHPWEHPSPERASVWRTEVHERWIMALPHAHRHRVEQFLYGAKGVKPTCLRTLNLGNPAIFARALQDGAEPWRPRPLHKLQGRNEQGLFRTAEAKEYPSALCRSLVVGLVQCLRLRAQSEGLRTPTTVPLADCQWLRNVLSTSAELSGHAWLPDYQGP